MVTRLLCQERAASIGCQVAGATAEPHHLVIRVTYGQVTLDGNASYICIDDSFIM
jgi:hypothetical protein